MRSEFGKSEAKQRKNPELETRWFPFEGRPMERMKSGRLGFLVMLVLAASLSLWGCSDPQENGDNVIIVDGNDDDDDKEQEDPVVDPCEGIVCEDGEICVEGECELVAAPGFSCAEPFDLGVLSEDGSFSKEVNPVGQPNVLQTTCGQSEESTQAVFQFSVEAPTRITFDTDEIDPLVPIPIMARELRVGSCRQAEAMEWCTINPRTFDAVPGEPYYLIIESNQGDEMSFFQMTYEVEQLACSPVGEWSCEGGERELCYQGREVRTFACADECAGVECQGNQCSNPIEVTGSQTFTGDFGAYENSFDFSEAPSCSTAQTTGVDTPGRDLVFALPGLTAGQKVTVDKGDLGLAVIAVMSECRTSRMNCLAGDTQDGELEWTVPADGSYYVVISPRTTSSGSFEFSIGIE